ncbi:uncharacterized protein LOC129758436 [Uranotaenia lowii]|uniref:uncharacterized protein LOC129758436 n=1 Tax=Uranotaenia lowii TaxID=190385 RepID=UPI002479F18E|nr:uncharacterized protein LOC129758436 [Uranotaenia lowii]
MANRGVWGTCMNGEVEIICYNDDKFRDQSMDVLRKSCFLNEMVCIGSEVNLDLQAQKDLEQLCLDVARSGVSLIARHISTDRIVSVAFNVLQTPSARGDLNYFESFRDDHCVSESSKNLMDYMIIMDSKVNLFEKFNVDCLMEVTFLATLPEYEGKGIATKLVSCSVEFARLLKAGQAFENLPEDAKLKRPKLVTALFTSKISQRVGTKNGFTQIMEVPHHEFSFRDKTYAERIGSEHPTSILVVKEI